MAQRGSITYDRKPGSRFGTTTYYLATTSDVVRFYLFEEPKEGSPGTYSLIDQLDRSRLQGAGDKATAKEWAKRLGLTTYIYVRV